MNTPNIKNITQKEKKFDKKEKDNIIEKQK